MKYLFTMPIKQHKYYDYIVVLLLLQPNPKHTQQRHVQQTKNAHPFKVQYCIASNVAPLLREEKCFQENSITAAFSRRRRRRCIQRIY